MSVSMRKTKAWAIALWGSNKRRRPALAGVFYFNQGTLLSHQDGMRTALFSTRRAAQKEAKRLNLGSRRWMQDWYKNRASVVRVQVSIRVVKRLIK